MNTDPDPATDASDRLSSEGVPKLRGQKPVLAATCVALAFFLATLGQSSLATAMPSIVDDLGGFGRYTWVSAAHLVASVVAIPIIGGLSDMYGRRPLLIVGILLFIIGSTLAALSQSMTQLTSFAAVQGAGAGGLVAVSFVAVGDLFRPEERGKYMGYLSAVFGIAVFAGLVLGGAISDWLIWRGIFALNVLAGLPVLALAFRFPRIEPQTEHRKLDWPGMAALALAIMPIMIALSLADIRHEWNSWQTIGALAFGLAMAVLFVIIESRAASPIMPMEIYRNPVVTVSAIISFFIGYAMYSIIVFAPLFFQTVRGASATVSGWLLASMVIGLVIGSMITGRMLSRADAHYRIHALAGTAALTAGTFLLSLMDSDVGYGEAAAYVLIAGYGVGSTVTSVTVAVQNSTAYRLMGAATSALQFYRTVSGTLALAILGTLLGSSFASNLLGGIPAEIQDALRPGQIQAIIDNPQNFVGPYASATPQFVGMADSTGQLADRLVSIITAAMAKSISLVFLTSAALLVLSVIAALFLREQNGENE